MEQDWKPALVHESGHALMAILHGIPCNGICFESGIDGGRFCVLLSPSLAKRSDADYLVSAAGVAAELLIYPNQISAGAEADRADFDSAQAPSFEETVSRAQVILAGEKNSLDKLITALNVKMYGVDGNPFRLPETVIDGSSERCRILLSKDDLQNSLQ